MLNLNCVRAFLYPVRYSSVFVQRRNFWEYVNRMFNEPDHERLNRLGPDRTCAEWVLRNGGTVVWETGKKESDYNALPPENQSVPYLAEINGTNSSISHYGFSHLNGCTKLHKIIIDNCVYVDDRAMKGLEHGKSTLTHVQVSMCQDVTDAGVKELKVLNKLETLVLYKLSSVDNLEECKQYLKTHLVNCKIE